MVLSALKDKLSKIKLLAMDVDGTLTDSAMYYSAEGEELKRFSTRDGMGITLLHKAGILTAIITSENSAIVSARARKLSIGKVVLHCRNKVGALRDLADEFGLTLNEIAFIGDDVNDLHAIEIAGASACPADATKCIIDASDYVCSKNGGYGAVREFCELILTTQNKKIVLDENW